MPRPRRTAGPLAWAALAALAACSSGNDGCGSGEPSPLGSGPTADPLQLALSMREQVTTTPERWPAGVTWLAIEHTVTEAIDRGDELVASSKGRLLRVPKNGGEVVVLVDLPGREVRNLAVGDTHVVATIFPVAVSGVGVDTPGQLIAVPLAGGRPRGLLGDVGILVELASSRKGVWFVRSDVVPRRIDWLAEPTFEAGAPAATHERRFERAIVDERGVTWGVDRGVDEAASSLFQLATGSKTPKELRLHPDARPYSIRGGPAGTFLLQVAMEAKTAPGAGTYYDENGSLIQVERDLAGTKAVAADLSNPDTIAVGAKHVCIALRGPKLEFGKRSAIAAWSAGSAVRKLAEGLQHATCLAADAGHFYVKVSSRTGIARVPVGP